MTVELIPESAMNHIVANLKPVKNRVRQEANEVGYKANARLWAIRATTTHAKIDQDTAHETNIKVHKADDYGPDWLVTMEAVNPLAIEYGHYPSGYFDPDRYGRITKSPSGLYILTGAAGFPGRTVVSGPTRRGVNAGKQQRYAKNRRKRSGGRRKRR